MNPCEAHVMPAAFQAKDMLRSWLLYSQCRSDDGAGRWDESFGAAVLEIETRRADA